MFEEQWDGSDFAAPSITSPDGFAGGIASDILRVGLEFFHATRAAEVVILPAMVVDVFGSGGIHIHSADRVAFERRRLDRMVWST